MDVTSRRILATYLQSPTFYQLPTHMGSYLLNISKMSHGRGHSVDPN